MRAELDEDDEFTAALYASTRWQELAQVPWSDEQKTAFLRMQHEAQRRHYREHYADTSWDLILCDGERIGRLYVTRGVHEIRIVDIALLPDWRGRGVGSGLIRALQAEAVNAGRPLRIHVEQFNPALRLYQRLGFTPIDQHGVHLLMESRGVSAPVGQVNTAS